MTRRLRRSPPIRGLSYTFRKSPVAHDCVVVNAVPYELVSAVKFPDIREFTGNFLQFAGIRPLDASKTHARLGDYTEIP
jgi:hypothetical protein